MYKVYILHNDLKDRYYIGYTSDIEQRLIEHNKPSHRSKFTRKQEGEWKLVYSETYLSKTEAITREKAIKKMKSRKYIEDLVEQSR